MNITDDPGNNSVIVDYSTRHVHRIINSLESSRNVKTAYT